MSPRAVALTLAVLAAGLLGVERPEGLGDVTEVRHWSYPNYTRVVVELTREVAHGEVRQLGADPGAGRPARLYLDLEGVWVGRRYLDGLPVGDGLLQGVRLGQFTERSSRLVLDLEHYQRHRLLTLRNPDRVVIDVFGSREAPPPAPPDGGFARLPMPLRAVHTVVVDAGHGGRDPGAIGAGGLREKDVTLRLALALGAELEARAFRVLYTRTDDRYLDLEERTAIAEGTGGDLFVSLHANAAPRRSVSGVEVYYLDENHERHSVNLAARENGIDRSQVNVLQRTLAKLHMEEVSPHSRRLATLVQRQLVTGMPRRYQPMQDLGVKRGPFYVLFLSDMPAILVESGFLTNRQDAARLRESGYLDSIAHQIAIALTQYRDVGSKVARREGP